MGLNMWDTWVLSKTKTTSNPNLMLLHCHLHDYVKKVSEGAYTLKSVCLQNKMTLVNYSLQLGA